MIHLNEGEYVVAVVRKHWFIFLWRALGLIFMFFVPFIVYGLVGHFILKGASLSSVFPIVTTPLLVFFIAMWGLVVWMAAFVMWTDFYIDSWFLTNQRLVDIDQQGLFHREISSVRLDRIQDITVDVPGVIATLIGFGVVHVQTAGDTREFTIAGVPQPRLVQEYIQSQVTNFFETYYADNPKMYRDP